MPPGSQNPFYTNPLARSYIAQTRPDNSTEIKKFYTSLPAFKPTSLIPLPSLAKELGIKHAFVKAEVDRLGLPSFKMLGASWAVRQAVIQRCALPSDSGIEELRKGVREMGVKLCAATDGNHGRAVARVGQLLGVGETKIFVPKGLGERAKELIASEGAEVIVVDGDYDDAVRVAHKWGGETSGGMLIEGTAFEGYEDVPRVCRYPSLEFLSWVFD
jgi:diaminopropionate ammonia-lyase